MTTKWYSINEEDFTSTELDDVVADAWDNSTYASGAEFSVWEGDAVVKKAGSFLNVDLMLEHMTEAAYDESGDWAEDWLQDCTNGQTEDLACQIYELVNQWADVYKLQPKFGTVENVKEIRIRITSEEGDWEAL